MQALDEFIRVLKPGGNLFLTVPFGRYEDHGWQQQFDSGMVSKVTRISGVSNCETTYYRYYPEGWQLSSESDCVDCAYHDFNARKVYDSDYAAAARAVACIQLKKR